MAPIVFETWRPHTFAKSGPALRLLTWLASCEEVFYVQSSAVCARLSLRKIKISTGCETGGNSEVQLSLLNRGQVDWGS